MGQTRPGSWSSPSDPVETFIAILAWTFSVGFLAESVGFFFFSQFFFVSVIATRVQFAYLINMNTLVS